MPSSTDYLNYVIEQLAGLNDVTSRRMFGGWGLYSDEIFFALIFEDTLYFKVGDANRSDYESRGMRAFRPYADREHVSLSYYEVPADALEDGEQLKVWARRSIEVALVAAAAKPARRTSSATGNSRRKVQRKSASQAKSASQGRAASRGKSGSQGGAASRGKSAPQGRAASQGKPTAQVRPKPAPVRSKARRARSRP